jgi:hypothetical protein
VVLSPVAKQPGHEANYSPPSSAEVMHYGSYTSIPQHAFMVSTKKLFTLKKYKKSGGATRYINSSTANEMIKQA